MNQRNLSILLLAFLCACSDRPSPQAEPQATHAPAVAEVTAPAAAPSQSMIASGYSPLPKGLVIASPFHVRNDRIYTTKSGTTRRRAMLELLDANGSAVADSLGEQLQAQGFRPLAVDDKNDGVTRRAFVQKGRGRINLSTSADVGGRPANPEAKALLAIDWQP